MTRSASQESFPSEKFVETNPRNLRFSVSVDSKLTFLLQQPTTESSDEENVTTEQTKYRGIKYSKGALHGAISPAQFDHNFMTVTAATKMPKHLPPIREFSQQQQQLLTSVEKPVSAETRKSELDNPIEIKPSHLPMKAPDAAVALQSQKSDGSSSSPQAERQARLRNKLLSNNSIDLPDLTPQSRIKQQQRVLKTPLLVRVQDGETAGSETPSPLSSPSTSSYDDEDGTRINFLPQSHFNTFPFQTVGKTASVRHKTRQKSSKVAAICDQKQEFVMVKKKSISMASLVSKASDSDDSNMFRLHPNSMLSTEQSFSAESFQGKPNTMSIPRERALYDAQLPKSRSLACLAAATVAQMAGNHPLMVKEARSRSYLVGSVGHTSMLGTEELERYFPERKLRLFVGSWNMNGQTPPVYLADFLLPQNIEFVPDLLVIGTQECMGETKEWEIRLQDTLGPSHVLFHSHGLGTLHLAIFLRRDLIWFCSVPEVDSFSTRPGSTFKTKGAVAIAFLLFGTSFLFVNSHLTAHQENVQDRIRDLTKINAMLHLPRSLPIRKRHRNLADNFDCAFWCGDLNFRIEQTREVVIRDVRDGLSVLEFDQLNYLRSEGLIFGGYIEDPIRFLPTYKYDPGTNNFDTSSKQRVPSYTDRILYKCHKSTPVTPLHYDIVPGVVTSDHKPVWGMWETLIRPGKDSVPLSGGLFNREVYLEGLRRRSEALKPLTKGRMNMGNMCTLQ